MKRPWRLLAQPQGVVGPSRGAETIRWNSERTPNVDNSSPRQDKHISAAEAHERYQFAKKRSAEQLTELHEALSLEADVMQVLYLLYLDIGSQAIHERTDPQGVYHARERGWITGDRHLTLTAEGLGAWWDWKQQVTPHVRDERFQQLWRDVIAW